MKIALLTARKAASGPWGQREPRDVLSDRGRLVFLQGVPGRDGVDPAPA